MIKAVTLLQPWAELMADNRKTHETRSWYPYQIKRGELLAITASAKLKPEDRPEAIEFGYNPGGLTLGCVVAVVRFLEAHKTEHMKVTDEEGVYGDYTPGRFAWRCALVLKMSPPVPCRGSLGVWKLPADVEALVRAQLEGNVETEVFEFAKTQLQGRLV